jgi:hypothetical protein
VSEVEAETGEGELQELEKHAARQVGRDKHVADRPMPWPAITASIAFSSSLNVRPLAAMSTDYFATHPRSRMIGHRPREH